MQQCLVLLILCILCIHVHKNKVPPRYEALACSLNLQLVVKQSCFTLG